MSLIVCLLNPMNYTERNIGMNSLFHVKSKNTYDEYKKYVLTFNKKKMLLTILLVDTILLIIALLTKVYYFFIPMIIIPIIEYFSLVRPLKKIFYSNKMAVNAEIDYDFYETYFIKISKAGTEKVEYKNVLKIIETKTNFYLMIAYNQGYMLKKADMPDGLDAFLGKLDIKNK